MITAETAHIRELSKTGRRPGGLDETTGLRDRRRMPLLEPRLIALAALARQESRALGLLARAMKVHIRWIWATRATRRMVVDTRRCHRVAERAVLGTIARDDGLPSRIPLNLPAAVRRHSVTMTLPATDGTPHLAFEFEGFLDESRRTGVARDRIETSTLRSSVCLSRHYVHCINTLQVCQGIVRFRRALLAVSICLPRESGRRSPILLLGKLNLSSLCQDTKSTVEGEC